MLRIALILLLLLACPLLPAQEVVDDGYPVSSLKFPGVDPFGLAWPCIEPFIFESPLNRTYVTADMVAFRRDWAASDTFATLGTTATNSVLGTHDLPFVFQPGLRLLAGRRVNDWIAIEASYLGLLDWNEQREVRNTTVNSLGSEGNLFSPFSKFGNPPIVGFDYNDFASIKIVSTFHNAELNMRQRLATPPSILQASAIWGLRYINIYDQFTYKTQSAEPVVGGTNTNIDVQGRNNLYGVQVGMAVEFQIERRCWLLFEAKGMLMANSASQQTEYTTGPLARPDATITGAHSQGRVTLGGDLAATLEWKITPGIVARFGYQGIFLDGLALGADNLLRNLAGMTTNPNLLSDDGHLAYQGPFAGVTATW
jgi:hypothetical protein